MSSVAWTPVHGRQMVPDSSNSSAVPGARKRRTRRASKQAVMRLLGALLVCGLAATQARAQVEAGDRQSVRSIQSLVTTRAVSHNQQHDRYRRQSNDTDVGDTLSSTGTAGGSPSTISTTTDVEPPGESSTAAPDSFTSTTTEPSNPQTSTTPTGGDVSDTQVITTTSSTTSPTSTPLPSTESSEDTISSTSSAIPDAITIIITTTLDDGSVQTTASTASATSASDTNKDEDSSNHKAWIIPLSVVAGIVALAGFLFLGYRCTQRRFSELDDEDGNGIRWPELLQKHGDEGGTTLNPLATKRREGAGFDMDEDKSASQFDLVENDGMSAHGRGTPNPSHAEIFANAGLGAPAVAMARTASSGGSSNGGSAVGAGYYGAANAYYDPYLGASGAPYPPPPRVMSPQQPPYFDPYQDNPDYAPETPHYPPPTRSTGSNGRASPYQGSPRAASPAIAGRLPANAVPIPTSSPYAEYEDAYDQALCQPMSPIAADPTAPRASPPLPHSQSAPRQPLRLSIANPDGLVEQ